jgi:hypothetical protein
MVLLRSHDGFNLLVFGFQLHHRRKLGEHKYSVFSQFFGSPNSYYLISYSLYHNYIVLCTLRST